jgi:hypothetical protein
VAKERSLVIGDRVGSTFLFHLRAYVDAASARTSGTPPFRLQIDIDRMIALLPFGAT